MIGKWGCRINLQAAPWRSGNTALLQQINTGSI